MMEVDPNGGLQQERTALAWERTAISMMVAGLLLARFAAKEGYLVFAAAGIAQTILGGVLLMWTTRHYIENQAPVEAGEDIVHPTAARIVGLGTVIASGIGLLLAVILLIAGI
jgi:inner membrane protein YidH